MSSYSNLDQANGAPTYQPFGHSNATGTTMYGNTTPNAFIVGQTMGVFGVSDSESANASAQGKGRVNPGWVLTKFGHGPITSLIINNGGTGFSNTDNIKATGGSVNAVANVVTSNTGVITSYSFSNTTNAGRFTNTAGVTISFANSTNGASAGSGANIAFTLGGHAGRATFETLAFVNMASENSADNTTFPG